MADELKDRKSDKETITERNGTKKVIEANKANFAEKNHGRKHSGPAFTDDDPKKGPIGTP